MDGGRQKEAEDRDLSTEKPKSQRCSEVPHRDASIRADA